MKSIKLLFHILVSVILLFSCTFSDNLNVESDTYNVTYVIDATDDAFMTKIKYTNENGNTELLTDFDLPWKVETTAKFGQTLKLEVYGDRQASDICLQINAANADNTITRDLKKEKNSNKHYHYYIIHTLQ